MHSGIGADDIFQGALLIKGFSQMLDLREIAEKLDGPFDIILNDIDKQDYPRAFDIALKLLRPGGIFITDNVLWSGRIITGEPDETTAKVQEFNRKLFNSNGIISSIMPIRDGLGLAVKL